MYIHTIVFTTYNFVFTNIFKYIKNKIKKACYKMLFIENPVNVRYKLKENKYFIILSLIKLREHVAVNDESFNTVFSDHS